MDTELWLITGGMVVFFILMFVIQWMQHRITKLESRLRAIKWECQGVLDNIGPLSADDAPDLAALSAIGEYAGDDAAGQLFEEVK